MAKSKYPEITIIVLGHDVFSELGSTIDAEEFEAIGSVFFAGAAALREGKHGAIDCTVDGEILAEVAIDRGIPWDFDKGLPVIQKIEVQPKNIKRGPARSAKR